MIPEGVMVENAGKLRICLQSNFRDGQRITRRQRFTWAHEICHALFYDQTEGLARLMPGAPSGAALERMCQQGAGYLLIPSSDFAGACSREKPVSSTTDLDVLSERYQVSTDVMLRRLHESGGSLLNDYAILLLRTREGHSRIDAAAFGPWLRAHIDAPEIGQAFDQWADPILRTATQVSNDAWKRGIGDRELTLTRKPFPKGEFVELRLDAKSFQASTAQ